jgi:hypothetical protein
MLALAFAVYPTAQEPAAGSPDGVVVFANDYVIVRRVVADSEPSGSSRREALPPVLTIRVDPGPGVLNSTALMPPASARLPSGKARPSVSIQIQLLNAPPAPSALGSAGSELPRGAVRDREWAGGCLMLAEFAPMVFGSGAGGHASVTTVLSDGVVDVTSRGVRRRFGVRAGDAFWFEAHTRITVVSDDPVGVAVVQLYPDLRRVPRPD